MVWYGIFWNGMLWYVLIVCNIIPRRSFRQKFLPFSGRAALPVLGRKPTFCRGNVFVAANFPFQESSERLHIFYIEQLNLFGGLHVHWAFLPGMVTSMIQKDGGA